MLFPSISRAQVQACPILVPVEQGTLTKDNNFEFVETNVPQDAISWENKYFAKFSDDQYAEVSLEAGELSAMLLFDNFNFNLPIGTTIKGIEVAVEGHSAGGELMEDAIVQLLRNGNPEGINLANNATYGQEWESGDEGDDQHWVYGAPWYHWNSSWNMDEINHENFGLRIQLKNNSDELIIARIDRISLRVYYDQLYTLCDHDCVAFYVDDAPGADYYEWIVPDGFQIITGQPNEDIINIGVTDAAPGIHTICVQTVSPAGTSDECCRDFLFDDCRPSSIGDFVWFDVNGNGIQETGEAGIENVIVNLHDMNGEILQSTLTDESGHYSFLDIQKGFYFLSIEGANDYIVSLFNIGGDEFDNDLSEENGPFTTSVFYLSPGEDMDNIDFGLTQLSVISGLVWDDVNLDGSRQGNEVLLSNVAVDLLDASGNVLASTETTNGFYLFEDLYPDTYQISIQAFGDYVPTLLNEGNDNFDNDFDDNGLSPLIELIGGVLLENIDAGFYELGSIGNYIWFDLDGDGSQDANESGLANINIELVDSDGNTIATTISDENGFYLFDDIVTGNYFIRIVEISDLFIATRSFDTNALLDSNLDETNGSLTTNTFFLPPGEDQLSIDLGLTQLSTIWGMVWDDVNINGIRESNELPIAGIRVFLLDESGIMIGIAETQSDGAYSFLDVFPGIYSIQVEAEDNWSYTLQDVGDDETDSDVGEDGKSDPFLLEGAVHLQNLDAGLYELGSIGDYVWLDKNGNGTQDNDEIGLANIQVNLHQEDGAIIQTENSNDDGSYIFEGIVTGNYYLSVEIPNGYILSTLDEVGQFGNDLGSINGPATTADIFVNPGENLNTIDLALTQYGSIEGLTWNDKNVDGIRQADDEVLPEVSIDLFDSVNNLIASTSSDLDGNYIFSNVYPGEYYVVFDIKDQFVVSEKNQGLDDEDSDIDENGFSDVIEICADQHLQNLDAGFYELGSIGDYVWLDKNGNGIQESNESGLANIPIDLFAPDGTLLSSTSSDDSGFYVFDNLVTGEYYVQLNLNANSDYIITQEDAGSDDEDSDLTNANGDFTTSVFWLMPGVDDMDLDLGLTQLGSITGLTWSDLNLDGIRQLDEPSLGNTVVSIVDEDFNVMDAQITIENGIFFFDDLYPGFYIIQIVTPDGYAITLNGVGDESTDSDLNEDGRTEAIELCAGQNITNVDAGFYALGSIGDYVWFDFNGNGIQDPEDADQGKPEIEVNLHALNGDVLETTFTDDTGYYLFENVAGGSYYISVVPLPSSINSLVNQGSDEALDNDLEETFGPWTTGAFDLAPGQNIDYIDIGLTKYASISGMLWEDQNYDGMQQASEPVVDKFQVQLFDANQDLVATTSVESDGSYTFSMVFPGYYEVVFVPEEANLFPTLQNIGMETIDSDIDDDFSTGLFLLSGNEPLSNLDAGFYVGATIGNYAWLDLNMNGIQDEDEDGLENVMVNLINADGNIIAQTETDDKGLYTITGIAPGTYMLTAFLNNGFEPTINVSNNSALDSDIMDCGTSFCSNAFELNSGDLNVDLDIGLVGILTLSGVVFMDENSSGLIEMSETLVEGIVVNMYSDGVLSGTTVTDENGFYIFENLPSGQYYIEFELPDYYLPTIPNFGNDLIDSDITNLNGPNTTSTVNLVEFNMPGINAGLVDISSTIRGKVWEDVNFDGIRDNSEPLVANVAVNLFDLNNNFIASTSTDDQGAYEFNTLNAGGYYVMFEIEDEFTLYQIGPSITDSDVNDINGPGTTDMIILPFSTEVDFIDAGFYQDASIKGVVWQDDNDGIFESSESLIEGVVVNLLDANGFIIQTQETNGDGEYLFINLAPGTYSVSVVLPPSYELAPSNQGNDETLDSDLISVINGVANSESVTLISGEHYLDLDAGLFLANQGGICGFVWEDINFDGDKDNNESGLNNVEVNLFNSNDELVASTNSGNDGAYVFAGVEPGNYYLVFESINGYFFTLQDVASDNSDSDVNSNGQTEIFTLDDFQKIDHVFAGYYQTGLISGQVWSDDNCDGIQDGDEAPVSGIEVCLLDESGTVLQTLMSDEFGGYIFNQLLPGSYVLRFKINDQYLFTDGDVGNNDEIDSDVISVDGDNGDTDSIQLLSGDQAVNVDAGLKTIMNNIILGQAWIDENCDGILNNDELPLGQVQVRLLDDSGQVVGNAVTTSAGNYFLFGMFNGDYTFEFTLPSGFKFTDANVGSDDALDSEAVTFNGSIGTSDIVSIGINQNIDDFNVGAKIIQPSNIQGLVWIDEACDGSYNNEDELFEGINVLLVNTMGMLMDQSTTDSDGSYEFLNVDPGDYSVVFELPDGYKFTTADLASDENDSDVVNVTPLGGATDIFTLDEEETITNIYAGIKELDPIQIFGTIWNDENCNGLRDPGEPNMPAVTVNVLDDTGASILSTVTDMEGEYAFIVQDTGNYQIQFTLTPGYEFTLALQGVDNTIDSDVINILGIEGTTDVFFLDFEDQLLHIDAGFKEVSFINITGTLWEDINGDGIRDLVTEMGTEGLIVELFDDQNMSQGTTTTDANGAYSFTGFPLGTYYVQMNFPNGTEATMANVGTNDLIDSDITGGNGVNTSELITGSTQQLDGGYYFFGTIGNFVWSDDNANGIQDAGEAGINSIMVRLFDLDGNLISTQFTGVGANPDGFYQFTNVPAGFYYVSHTPTGGMLFTNPNVGSNDEIDSDINSANGFGTTGTIALISGETNNSIDIGLIQEPGTIGDRVWLDLNSDGIQDDDEPGINGVTVTLKNVTGDVIATDITMTNATLDDGYYEFLNVQPGSYYIVFETPAGHVITLTDQGGNDTKDSDITNGMEPGSTNIFNLSAGENDKDIDAGFYQPGELGNFVWLDDNENGIQDPGEDGVSNVTVNLHLFNGTVINSTTTNANGEYCFTGLTQGVYFISVVPPTGLMFTDVDQGTNDSLDSDVDPTGTSNLVSLAHGVLFKDLDAGLIGGTNMIGSRVWLDMDNDGIQDAEDLGMEEVKVRLMNSSNVLIQQTTTNFAGKYVFENILPGNYYVSVVKPEGYEFTQMDMGSNDDMDNDFNSVGETSMFSITGSSYIMNIDAGLTELPNVNIVDDYILEFKGYAQTDYNELSWQLSEDFGYRSIFLQRMNEDEIFEDLKEVSGEDMYEFAYDDLDIDLSENYTYRLKLVLSDASVIYSDWVTIYRNVAIQSEMTSFPNPIQNNLKLKLSLGQESTVEWSIVSNMGEITRAGKISQTLSKGDHYLDFDLTDLKSGQYYIKVKLKNELIVNQISIIK